MPDTNSPEYLIALRDQVAAEIYARDSEVENQNMKPMEQRERAAEIAWGKANAFIAKRPKGLN